MRQAAAQARGSLFNLLDGLDRCLPHKPYALDLMLMTIARVGVCELQAISRTQGDGEQRQKLLSIPTLFRKHSRSWWMYTGSSPSGRWLLMTSPSLPRPSSELMRAASLFCRSDSARSAWVDAAKYESKVTEKRRWGEMKKGWSVQEKRSAHLLGFLAQLRVAQDLTPPVCGRDLPFPLARGISQLLALVSVAVRPNHLHNWALHGLLDRQACTWAYKAKSTTTTASPPPTQPPHTIRFQFLWPTSRLW